MYYDQGGAMPPVPQQRPVPYLNRPTISAPGLMFGRPRPGGGRRPVSYADYYNGNTGGGSASQSGPQRPYFDQMPYMQTAQGRPAPFNMPQVAQPPQRRWLNASGYQHPTNQSGAIGYMRDINGNVPGEWDYQQPSPYQQRTPVPMYMR